MLSEPEIPSRVRQPIVVSFTAGPTRGMRLAAKYDRQIGAGVTTLSDRSRDDIRRIFAVTYLFELGFQADHMSSCWRVLLHCSPFSLSGVYAFWFSSS
jgi:hypothetical protein